MDQTGMKRCVDCLVGNGYTLIGYDDEIHARLRKFIDKNEFMVLVIGPHSGNNYGYILRGEFVDCFDKWSNATYQRQFSNDEDFVKNWYKFWMFETFDCE